MPPPDTSLSPEESMPAESAAASDTNALTLTGVLDPARPVTELRLPDGRTVRISTALLESSSPALDRALPSNTAQSSPDETRVIPIIEEQLQVGKRTTITGKVLLEKHTLAYDETLDVPLAVLTFDIERVVLNRPVDAAPPIRHEGTTTIYPLVEEQLLITTQLILKEELHVTQRDTKRRDNRTVTLHRETIEVTRTPTTS